MDKLHIYNAFAQLINHLNDECDSLNRNKNQYPFQVL